MTTPSTLKKFALAAVLTLGGFASGASAMTLHNCTHDPLMVSLMNNAGSFSQPTTIAANGTSQIHATRSLGPYRIVLPQLGEGAHFSGRDGDGTFSLIRTGGGNIGIRDGNACAQAGGGGNAGGGGEICYEVTGGRVCYRP
ncbi:hypothetical protein [Gymnodinialimonas sp.]